MFSHIASDNLEKDRRVLGKGWHKTYGGYFSDGENIQRFVDAVVPCLPNRSLDVLYVASASGMLGEALMARLGQGALTLVDVSKEHLAENKNPMTRRVVADLLTMDLGKRFDVVLMRSALDYFPSRELQVDALERVRKHLVDDGVFINQPAYLADPAMRDAVSDVYRGVEKLGDRFFQSSDLEDLYASAGFGSVQRIGEGKELVITEGDHKERYDLDADDIARARVILLEAGFANLLTESGYRLTFTFPIFLA